MIVIIVLLHFWNVPLVINMVISNKIMKTDEVLGKFLYMCAMKLFTNSHFYTIVLPELSSLSSYATACIRWVQ